VEGSSYKGKVHVEERFECFRAIITSHIGTKNYFLVTKRSLEGERGARPNEGKALGGLGS